MSELRVLQRLLAEGKISRREFLVRLSALGISAALLPEMLSTAAWAATPKKGGRLRQGLDTGSTTDSLDPAMCISAMPNTIAHGQLYNNLVEIDYKGEAIPELAENWESTPDAKKWTFKIRKGVEFHNGKTLDAEDVVFSINHHRGETNKSGAKGAVNPIADIKADDKYTVTFTLREGNADFPYLLSDYHLGILPAGTTDFQKGIGTGGYSVVKFEPGIRCLTKRYPNYWKEGRAHFDEVETIAITDMSARVNALRTGQVDYINRVDTKIASFLEKEPGIQLINVVGNYHYSFPMLTDTPPYDNNNVRLALKYAVNREAMVKAILGAYGRIGNDNPIGSTQRFFASELPQRVYDPEKAKFHLKKSGIGSNTFKLHTADNVFPGSMDASVLYKEHAAKAGINIEVVREPDDGYWKNVWMKRPWCTCYWTARPTVDFTFSTIYAEGADVNDTHWKHERFNKLLKEARAELNVAKRREMYVEMQRLVRDEGGVVIPMLPNTLEAGTPKLKHGEIAANWQLDGFKLSERWWFEG